MASRKERGEGFSDFLLVGLGMLGLTGGLSSTPRAEKQRGRVQRPKIHTSYWFIESHDCCSGHFECSCGCKKTFFRILINLGRLKSSLHSELGDITLIITCSDILKNNITLKLRLCLQSNNGYYFLKTFISWRAWRIYFGHFGGLYREKRDINHRIS